MQKISELTGSKQASKQVEFLPSDRYFSFFWVVISVTYIVLFVLGKCLLDSYELFFKYTEFLALQLLCITVRIPDGMFLFPLASN